MENDRLTELVITISAELSALNAQTKATLATLSKALDTLSNHENRLTKLEVTDKASIKGDILMLSVKGLVISVCALGALAGAGSIIAKVCGF